VRGTVSRARSASTPSMKPSTPASCGTRSRNCATSSPATKASLISAQLVLHAGQQVVALCPVAVVQQARCPVRRVDEDRQVATTRNPP
jgi:hypothetical protein